MNYKSANAQEVEKFIEDWYWDEESHQYVRKLGQFLFQFLDSLKEQGLSEKTIRKHRDNCWFIGSFECGYGFRSAPGDVFYSSEANYEYE